MAVVGCIIGVIFFYAFATPSIDVTTMTDEELDELFAVTEKIETWLTVGMIAFVIFFCAVGLYYIFINPNV